jgi:hypothetical protein
VRSASKPAGLYWRLALFVLCGMLAVLVAACGGGDDDDGGGGGGSTKKVDMAAELKKPANLTVWAWTPGTEEAVKMFEKAHRTSRSSSRMWARARTTTARCARP